MLMEFPPGGLHGLTMNNLYAFSAEPPKKRLECRIFLDIIYYVSLGKKQLAQGLALQHSLIYEMRTIPRDCICHVSGAISHV